MLTIFDDDEDGSNEHVDVNRSPTDQLGLDITFESKMEEKTVLICYQYFKCY